MALLIFRGLRAEEILVIVLRQEFHRHRMALAGLHRGVHERHRIVLAHDAVGVEGVAGLMRQHVHVAGGAVEIGEDERHLVLRQIGAVAAGGLAGLGEHVEQFHVEHGVDELRRFGAQLMIHPLSGGEDLLRRALGLRVSVGEEELVVVQADAVHADAFLLCLLALGNDGDHVPCDLLTEGRDILRRVAVAAEAVVAELDVVLVAETAAALSVALFDLGTNFLICIV